jgi:hypothetical protein
MKLRLSLITLCVILIMFLPVTHSFNFATDNSIKSNSEDKKSLLTSSITSNTNFKTGMRSLFSISLSKFSKLSSKEKFYGYPGVCLSENHLGNGPVYCEGWNRYFKSEPGIKGKSFLTNTDYFSLKKKYNHSNKSATQSRISIPKSKNHFYFVGSSDYLSVYSTDGKVNSI